MPRANTIRIHARRRLLQFDFRTSVFELFLQGFAVCFRDAFFHGLRSAFDEVFGFFQAERRNDFADELDDFDFLRTGIGENNVELGLGFSRSGRSGAAASSCNGDRRSGRNAPFFLEKFRELGRFKNGQSREVFDNLFKICHGFDSCLVRLLRS